MPFTGLRLYPSNLIRIIPAKESSPGRLRGRFGGFFAYPHAAMPNVSSLPSVVDVLTRLRARRPLVHCLTNQVVKNFTANLLLAVGATPAMVEHPDEAEEFAAIADALLVNLGTLEPLQISAIKRAVPAALKAKRPWVLDPVAVGILGLRTEFARHLLELRPALVRGNASEIIALAGQESRGRGVDSGDSADAAIESARSIVRRTGGAVLVTGPIDYATDGSDVYACANGHELLTRVTGVGCAQGALAAACAAVASSPLEASVATAVILGVAGEMAAEQTVHPGTFQMALLDALDRLDGELLQRARIHR